jgi:hypothetical protein
VICLASVATGCGSSGFEAKITNKEPFTPPAVYASWWTATESCSDRTGRLNAITWYLAGGISGDGAVARGRWSEPHEIVIVKGYEADPKTVRHEMLHDLLGGDRSHSAAAWAECNLLFG